MRHEIVGREQVEPRIVRLLAHIHADLVASQRVAKGRISYEVNGRPILRIGQWARGVCENAVADGLIRNVGKTINYAAFRECLSALFLEDTYLAVLCPSQAACVACIFGVETKRIGGHIDHIFRWRAPRNQCSSSEQKKQTYMSYFHP